MPKDEELFVDYGYSVKTNKKGEVVGTQGPEWYRKAWEEQRKQANVLTPAAAVPSDSPKPAVSKRAKKTHEK